MRDKVRFVIVRDQRRLLPTKKQQGTFWEDGNALYINYSGGYVPVHIC